MSYCRQKSNRTNIVRYYTSEKVSSDISALKWLDSVRRAPGISVNYIALRDQHRRSEEGGGSTRLSGSIGSAELEEAFRSSEADLISLSCEFEGSPIVIGVDLRIHNVYLTLRKSAPADIAALEKLLQL